ncbi:hypothetical protein D5S18_26515 [Nocardia panacis]|uniref:Uncharacterized protein n=1 Tax=Nocardia panacis TaxID=2340916 RepID=A0A3A4KE76_9NOCA|nr:hypothetical protein D5S18_26515 [Nocardia panacis]
MLNSDHIDYAGISLGHTIVLMDRAPNDITWNSPLWIAAIASGTVYLALVWWIRRTRRSRGVMREISWLARTDQGRTAYHSHLAALTALTRKAGEATASGSAG